MDYSLHFYKKSWPHPSILFQESQTPYKSGGFTLGLTSSSEGALSAFARLEMSGGPFFANPGVVCEGLSNVTIEVSSSDSKTMKIWYRQYPFKSFKGCLPQVLLGPLLNTLSQMYFFRVICWPLLYLNHPWSQKNLGSDYFSSYNVKGKVIS